MNRILYGEPIACSLKEKAKKEIAELGVPPVLGIIQVGDNQASNVYVRNKMKVAKEVGVKVVLHKIPEDISSKDYSATVAYVVRDSNAAFLQLPVPREEFQSTFLAFVQNWASMDVDGLSIKNKGLLADGKPSMIPCTALGIMEMLKYYKIKLGGRQVCIIGRSDLVGKPLIQLFLAENATVISANSHTPKDKLKNLIRTSDIVVSAIGKPKFFDAEDFADGQTIIDVGINRDENGKLCGDCDTQNILDHLDGISITPVPKGVGLLTTAALMCNVVKSCK